MCDIGTHQQLLIQRRQQTHCRHSFPVVSQWQRYSLQRGRHQTHRQQHPRGPYSHDCRMPYRGKRHDGQGHRQPHQQEQLIFLLASLFLGGNFSFLWFIYKFGLTRVYTTRPKPNSCYITFYIV